MSITFLMSITPDDYEIATYAIRSFVCVLNSNTRIFLLIYCNGLSPELENTLRLYSKLHPRILVESNAERLRKIEHEIVVGEPYFDDAGLRHFREGRYESHGEILTRELLKLTSDLVGIIDADFEVLDPSFVSPMLEKFLKDQSLAFYSSDYANTHYTFETYFQRYAFIQARFHTYFCIYRRSALESYCDFTSAEKVQDEQLYVYDCGARMQEILIEKYGYQGRSLDARFRRQYVHYGAFSKNRSLNGRSLWAYRLVRISRCNGWIHKHHIYSLALIIRAFAYLIYQLFGLSRFDKERQRFLWDC